MTKQELSKHIGHDIVCVGYALQDLETGDRLTEWENVAIECDTCNEVLFDKE